MVVGDNAARLYNISQGISWEHSSDGNNRGGTMENGNRIISADSHIYEPPDLWQSGAPARMKARLPHVRRVDGNDQWWWNDDFILDVAGPLIQSAERNAVYDDKQFGKLGIEDWNAKLGGTWDDVMTGAYIPQDFIKDHDLDGVYASVVYPSIGLLLFGWPNSPELRQVFKSYNDWLADFCSHDPNRIIGVGMILLDDVEDSINELRRCKEMGLLGAMIPCYPEPRFPYSDPMYEPFWEAAEGLGVPLSFHISTMRGQPAAGWLGPMSSVDPKIAEFVGHKQPLPPPVDFLATTHYWACRGIGDMIFSGVFERHPKLMAVCVEFETAFVPHFLRRMDFTYVDYPDRNQLSGDGRFKNDMKPSDFWYRNVRITFQEDPIGLQRLRDLIGVHTMMWASDYPHREGTWPESLRAIDENFQGVPEDERSKIVWHNAAELYSIV